MPSTGSRSFREGLSGPYVDKTMLIDFVNARINGPRRCLCVTRPPGFGKTCNADMLTAYYDRSCDSEALFAPLKIGQSASFRQHLNRYHVLRLDASSYITGETCSLIDGKPAPKIDLVHAVRASICEELLIAYPEASSGESDLVQILMHIVSETGAKFVVILDKWDAFLRAFPDNEDLKLTYLLFLRSLFKAPHTWMLFAAVYLTGILPMTRTKIECAPNNFIPINLFTPATTADLFGFTVAEVRQYLSGTDLSFDDVAAWYGGYQVGGRPVFPPSSVRAAKESGNIGAHRNAADFREILQQCTDLDGLPGCLDSLLQGIPVAVDVGIFPNDPSKIKSEDDALTFLIHLGYLTYDASTKTVRIPNREIYSLIKSTLMGDRQSAFYSKIARSDQLLAAILSQDTGKAADLLAQSHEACSSQAAYSDHETLKTAIREALLTAADTSDRWEGFPARKGLAAILYLPKQHIRAPAILIELRVHHSAGAAIRQIKARNCYPTD